LSAKPDGASGRSGGSEVRWKREPGSSSRKAFSPSSPERLSLRRIPCWLLLLLLLLLWEVVGGRRGREGRVW